MEHGASECVKEQSHTAMPVKTEVDKAAKSTAYCEIQINTNFIKEEPGLVELVKSEPALLVKEEVVEDGWQDIPELQCMQGPSTSAIVGSTDVFDSIGDLDNILKFKEVLGAIDIGPTVLHHTDKWYTTNQDVSVVKEERTINHDKTDPILCGGVKKEIIEDEQRGSPTPQDSLMKQPGMCTALRSLHKERLEAVCRVQLIRQDTFQCEVCDAVYIDARKLFQHVQDLHGPGPKRSLHVTSPEISIGLQQCATADTDDQRGNKAAQSEQRVRSQLYNCDKCGKTYTKKDSLRSHNRNQHSTISHECTKCNKKFPSKAYLSNHTSTAHSEQQYECAVCKNILRSKKALNQHVYQIHRLGPAGSKARIYTCDYCKKIFTDKGKIRRHITHVHSSGSYKCHQCNKIFKCKKYLMRHKTNVHTAGSEALIYACDYCKKTFTKRVSILNHITQMHSSGSYKCHQCNKIFKCKRYLKAHTVNVHTTARSHRQFTCSKCGRNFKKKGNCQQHEKRCICTRPAASDTSAVASTSRQQHSVVIVKEEPADAELELGPVVFQHMDCNYRPYKPEPQLD